MASRLVLTLVCPFQGDCTHVCLLVKLDWSGKSVSWSAVSHFTVDNCSVAKYTKVHATAFQQDYSLY